MAKKSTLSTLIKQVQQLEDRLAVRESIKERPTVIINFSSYFPDGTVPNCLSRPLPQWEVVKKSQGHIVLDLKTELALRRGIIQSANIMDSELEVQEIEVSEDERVPYEVYIAWLKDELGKMGYLLFQNSSDKELFTIDRNVPITDIARKANVDTVDIGGQGVHL
jgi:hypothetical protein